MSGPRHQLIDDSRPAHLTHMSDVCIVPTMTTQSSTSTQDPQPWLATTEYQDLRREYDSLTRAFDNGFGHDRISTTESLGEQRRVLIERMRAVAVAHGFQS